MPCTTILVGRMASNDGSTIIARNDDAGSFHYTPKKVTVVPARKEPTVYKSVLSGVEIPMPGDAMSHTAAPNADGLRIIDPVHFIETLEREYAS